MDDTPIPPVGGFAEEDETPPVAADAPPAPTDIENMSDEEAARLAGPQINLPMQHIDLSGVNLRVVRNPEVAGERALIAGPLLVNFILPMSDETARSVATELTGGIEIASVMPRGRLR